VRSKANDEYSVLVTPNRLPSLLLGLVSVEGGVSRFMEEGRTRIGGYLSSPLLLFFLPCGGNLSSVLRRPSSPKSLVPLPRGCCLLLSYRSTVSVQPDVFCSTCWMLMRPASRASSARMLRGEASLMSEACFKDNLPSLLISSLC
jgi:hypothetical protein